MIAKRGYDLEQRIKTPDINLCKPQTPARSQFDTYPGQVGKIFFRIPTFFPYLYMFPEAFYISPSKQNGLLFCLSCPSPSQFDAELPSYQENHFFSVSSVPLPLVTTGGYLQSGQAISKDEQYSNWAT